jgi:MFS family permease
MAGYATVGTMCCAISVILANTGLFMRPLHAAMGWSRGDIALSLSLAALVMAAANPIIGTLIDRFGTRPVLIVSQATYGLSLAALPSLTEAFGLHGLYFAYVLIAGLGAGSTIVGYVRLLSGWFSGDYLSQRGAALGACSAGVPLGIAISGSLAVLAIGHFGWQAGFWTLAAFPLLIGLPVTVIFVRDAPIMISAGHGQLPGMTLKEAAGTRQFWLLVASVLIISSCLQGMQIHVPPYLADIGLSRSGLAAMVFFNGLIGIPSRLIAGRLFDRFFAPRVAMAVFALAALGALLMASYPILLIGLAGSVLLGVGQGAESDFIGYSVSRYFGLRHSGQIFGTIYGIFMLGVAGGPYLFGAAFDYWKNYDVPFLAAALGLGALCAILMFYPRFKKNAVSAANSVPEADVA